MHTSSRHVLCCQVQSRQITKNLLCIFTRATSCTILPASSPQHLAMPRVSLGMHYREAWLGCKCLCKVVSNLCFSLSPWPILADDVCPNALHVCKVLCVKVVWISITIEARFNTIIDEIWHIICSIPLTSLHETCLLPSEQYHVCIQQLRFPSHLSVAWSWKQLLLPSNESCRTCQPPLQSTLWHRDGS